MSNIREVLSEMAEDRGLFLPARAETPELPQDVTVLSSDQIMQYMSAYSALISYAATEEAIAKGEAEAAKGMYREARARRWIELRDDGVKRTVADTESLLDADDELVDYQKDRILAENYARLVESILKGFEQKYSLLSREVTRRGIAAERHFD